ncbi:MAG TPA: ABC transporter substrate-binding protein [Polyangia bacterium]|nr:ABC transporter substrate-binding protein [Polyangia bacterium]
MMRSVRSSRVGHGWWPLLILALVLVGGVIWGLGSALAASPAPSSSSGKVVLKLGWTEEPDNLNVFIGYQDTSYEIWALNYETLFGAGDRNQPTLDLASEFPTQQNGGISPDGKVWTIHIRPGVKFQDGVPLTASDVAFTYNYIIKNQLANLLLYVKGIESVKALNPTTVQFTCTHARALGYMETYSIYILPEHIWKHVPPQAATTSYGNKPPIVGSGAFETVAFVKGSYLRMVRNPYWWGKKPAIDEIYFEAYQNADTMVNDLTKGRIDGAWGVPVAEFKQLQSVKGITAIAYPLYDWDYLEFNCYQGASSLGNPVLRDWHFRNALNYALDKQRLVDLAYAGLSQPTTSIIPPNVWTNPDYHWTPPADQAYTFDLAKANQLLDQAGYRRGADGLRLYKGKPIVLRLQATTDQPACQIEAKLIAGWLQRLGLRIKLSVIDSGTLTNDIYNYHGNTPAPNFDLVDWEWTGYFDPGQTLSALTTPEIGNLDEPYWSNTQYDTLALDQASAVDPQKRAQTIWQMQQIMYQQSPWIPMTIPDYLEAVNTAKWTGWTRQFGGTGGAWELEGNIASYLNLRPRAVAATTGGSSNTTLIAVVVVIVIAAASIAFVFIRRRHGRRVEVED